jgi:hypothetical protein
MVQVLHLHNGDTLNQRLHAEQGWISKVDQSNVAYPEAVEQAYLRVLSRSPSGAERQSWMSALAEQAAVPRREVIEDIYWSLMTTREFLFQH